MISIINYGLGNLNAFVNVYNSLNITTKVIHDPKEIENADKIILPGVGSFDRAMSLLESKDLVSPIKYAALDKKIPILGVCVGMQIMANSSQEGKKKGLGLIDGSILSLRELIKQKIPIPHMGWNSVNIINQNNLFENIQYNSYFYFLHSFYYECKNRDNIICTSHYNSDFCSAVNKKNIYGVQFHPEKSHTSGLKLLENFYLI